MNTLVPYDEIMAIAECFDDRRLNRQRSDVTSVLRALLVEEEVDDHATIKMWRGSERFLIEYGVAMCLEYNARGNNDQTMQKILEFRNIFVDPRMTEPPEWWGDERLMEAHRSYLLRSKPSHYRPMWPDLDDDIPMFWPRSPEKGRKSPVRRERDRLIKKAYKAREKAIAAEQTAIDTALAAGLDPKTLEAIPDDELELIKIRTPSDDMLEL